MTKSFGLAYAVLAVTLLVVSGSIVRQYTTAEAAVTAPYWVSLPSASFDELFQRRAELAKAAYASDDPATYYAVVLPGLRAVARSAQTMIFRSPHRDMEQIRFEQLYTSTIGMGGVISSVHTNYLQRFGAQRMSEVALPYQEALSKSEYDGPHEPSGAYWLRWYLISLMLAGAFCLTRAYEKGLPVWLEFLQPSHLLMAVVAWPVFAWKYPRHTPAAQMRWALRYATLVLGTLLGGGAGIAKAETAKNNAKRDHKSKWSLQLDLRAADTIGGPSAPEGFGRATLVSPSGLFLESVNVIKKNFWLTSDTLGKAIAKPHGFVVNAVGGVVATSTGSRSATISLQIFGGRKHWGLAMPMLGIERQWTPNLVTTWTSTAQLFAKPTARLRVGVEGSVRKISGTKPSWYAGGLVGWSFGKGKPSMESLVFHNSAGTERVRVRATHALAF